MATRVREFNRFANEVSAFPQSTPALDNLYQTFIRGLTPSSSALERCIALAEKYHVLIHPTDLSKETLITHTKAFHEMFPQVKLEDKDYSYQLKNRDRNLLELQWNLIGAHISKQISASFELRKLIDSNPDFDAVLPQLLALLSVDTEIKDYVAQSALFSEEPRFFKLLLLYGYTPTDADLLFLFQMNKGLDKKAPKIKELVAMGVPFHPKCASATYADLKLFELLLSCGYKPTSQDLEKLVYKHDTEPLFPFLDVLRANGYVFSEGDCAVLLQKHFCAQGQVRFGGLDKYNPALPTRLVNRIARRFDTNWSNLTTRYPLHVTKELIQKVCPDPKLQSALFLKFPYSFLAWGFQPKLENFKSVVGQANRDLIYAMIAARKSDLSQEEVFCILSLSCYHEGLFDGQSAFSQELFRAAIDAKIDLHHIIKDDHRYDNSAQYRAWGKYSLESSDLDYALTRTDPSTFALLVHCWTYQPQRRWLKTVLESPACDEFLMEFIHAQFFVNSDDIQLACQMKRPASTFSILLNHGYVGIVDSRTYDYRGMMTERCHSEYRTTHAGYIPTQEDLDFARKQGCDKAVLDLLEEHSKRKARSTS